MIGSHNYGNVDGRIFRDLTKIIEGLAIGVAIFGIHLFLGIFPAISINITNSHNFHLRLPEELIEQALRSFAHPYKSNIYLRVRFVS